MQQCLKCFSCGGKLLSSSKGEDLTFIILGPEAAGKTTLLYKLKCPSWTGIKSAITTMRAENDDVGYHYEEFTAPFLHGIWEVPGNEAMKYMWPSFYRAIKMHGVVYVVDEEDLPDLVGITPPNKDKDKKPEARQRDDNLLEIRRDLHCLMAEDDLRNSGFAIIVNQKRQAKDKKAGGVVSDKRRDLRIDQVKYRLGLHELHPSMKWRAQCFSFNFINDLGSQGAKSKLWLEVLNWLRSVTEDSRGFGLPAR